MARSHKGAYKGASASGERRLTSRPIAGPEWGGLGIGEASAATLGNPIAEVPLAQVATRDGADDAVGLIRITGRAGTQGRRLRSTNSTVARNA
jgi:hypothetical protein